MTASARPGSSFFNTKTSENRVGVLDGFIVLLSVCLAITAFKSYLVVENCSPIILDLTGTGERHILKMFTSSTIATGLKDFIEQIISGNT